MEDFVEFVAAFVFIVRVVCLAGLRFLVLLNNIFCNITWFVKAVWMKSDQFTRVIYISLEVLEAFY